MDEKYVQTMRNLDGAHSITDQVEQIKYYDEKWATSYDDDIATVRKDAPEKFTAFVLKFIKNLDKNVSVIDIGGGTGIMGMKLKEFGYTNVHGHDGSKEMLKIAEERAAYKETFQEILIEDVPSKTMQKHGYDFMVSLGAFSNGTQLNERHLEAIIDLVKPGGTMILGFKRDVMTAEFENKLSELSSRCKIIQQEIHENYIQHRDIKTGEMKGWQGIFLAFEILA